MKSKVFKLGDIDGIISVIPKDVHTGMFGICIYEDLHEGLYFEGTKLQYKLGDNVVEVLRDKRGNPIDFDPQTFRCLSFSFFVDKSFLYSLDYTMKSNSRKISVAKIPIEKVDVESFEVLGLHYAKDCNQSYYAGKSKPLDDDITILNEKFSYENQRFEQLNATAIYMSYFAVGKKQVYYFGKEIVGADPSTFMMYSHDGWQKWLKDSKQVYSTNGPTIEVVDMDAETFICTETLVMDKYKPQEKLSWPEKHLANWLEDDEYIEFFKQNSHLKDYWFFSTQQKSPAPTIKEATHLGSMYYEYGDKIYYKSTILSDEEIIPDAKWEDYYEATMRRWRGKYAYTTKNGKVYRQKYIPILIEIEHCTKDNFRLLKYSFATNGKDLMFDAGFDYGLRIVPNVELEKLGILGESWFSIGRDYYYRYDSYNRRVKKFKADSESFTIINEIYACDKDGLIVEGVRKKQVPWTGEYKLIGGAYLKIGDTYYNYGKPLKNKSFDDSGTIKVVDFWTVVDKHGACLQEGRYYKKYKADVIE